MLNQSGTIARLGTHGGGSIHPNHRLKRREVSVRDLLKDFLFSKGYFVREPDADQHYVDLQPPVVIASLAKLFNIRVVANPD